MLRQRLKIADRAAGRDRLRGGDDRVRVDAVVAVEVADGTGLAELFDAERLVAAVQDLGGRIPVALTNILTVRDMLNAQSATDDPAMAIVRAGAAGNLSERRN